MPGKTQWDGRKLFELVGLVAVVLSLVFVGFELRQNTATVHAATLQALTDGSQEYLTLIATDPDLAAIQLKVSKSEELSEIEAIRWSQLRRSRWVRMQNAFSQFRRGAMDDADWSYYERIICRNDPAEWDQYKRGLTDSFAEFVDACIATDD